MEAEVVLMPPAPSLTHHNPPTRAGASYRRKNSMHTITDILYDEEDKELTAVIRADGRPKEIIDILGDALDTEEERRDALVAEAERMGYPDAVIVDDSPASKLAKSRWSRLTAEERSAEMSRRRKKGLKKTCHN